MFLHSEKLRGSAIKYVLTAMAVFFLSGAICTWIEARRRFMDPDSFYHLKMALLMRDHGIVRSFPWLPLTTLAKDYTDHHFLYHLLLIPFITAFGPYTGMIVATIFFAACTITLFYVLLTTYGARHAWAYTFILMTASSFIFRLNLAKASALSLLVLFCALIAIKKNNSLALFVISWLYVLLYGGWPIMIVVVGTFLAAHIVVDHFFDRHPLHSWARFFFWNRLFRGSRNAWTDFFSAPETRHAVAVVAGLGCGVVVNPYFPANIHFYWNQIVQIALIGYKDTIGVGSEWYPSSLDTLFLTTSGIFLLAMVAMTVSAFILFWPETLRHERDAIQRHELTAMIAGAFLTALFFVMTLRSKRHVEYFAPFAVFAFALLTDFVIRRVDIRAVFAKVSFFSGRLRTIPVAATVMVFVFLVIGAKDVVATHTLYANGVPWTRYAGATTWIAAHAPKDAIIFHSSWDEFPPLFFHDDGRRYIIGLDPTFLYLRDSVRYQLWVDVTTGNVPRGAAALVKREFGARYVFIAHDNEEMLHAFESDPGAAPVYKDKDAEIFALL